MKKYCDIFGIDDAAMATMGAGAVAGGASIAGGLISAEANKDIANMGYQQQRDAMLHGIQYRVEDAKRAGIHPLYALGAPGFNINPIAIQDTLGPSIINAGQSLGNAITRLETQDDRRKKVLDTALVMSQLSESDARRQMYLSEAQKNAQASGVGGLGIQSEGKPSTMPLGLESQAPNPTGVGIIDVKPQSVVTTKAGRPDVTAGINPTHEERMIAPGFPMLVPRLEGESLEEILSEMSYPAFAGLMLRNAEKYGKSWLEDYLKLRYLGQEPKNKYPTILEFQGKRGFKLGKEVDKGQSLRKKIEGAYKHLERR